MIHPRKLDGHETPPHQPPSGVPKPKQLLKLNTKKTHQSSHTMSSSSAPPQAADPLALNPDGSAADPAAFQAAVRADASKMQQLDRDPELRSVLLGADVAAMQNLLQQAYRVRFGALGCVRGGDGGRRCFKRRARSCRACASDGGSVCACAAASVVFGFFGGSIRAFGACKHSKPPTTQMQLESSKDTGRWMAERTIDAQRASATVRGCFLLGERTVL